MQRRTDERRNDGRCEPSVPDEPPPTACVLEERGDCPPKNGQSRAQGDHGGERKRATRIRAPPISRRVEEVAPVVVDKAETDSTRVVLRPALDRALQPVCRDP
jgi:hypothetical protein